MDVQKFCLFFSWFVAMKLLTLAQLESRRTSCRSRNRNRIVPFIIGGRDAKPGEFPFVVDVRYKGRHQCGGSIIDKHWIVTAAHCFGRKPNPDNFQVVVGMHIRDSKEGTIHQVNKVIGHEKFGWSKPLAYDIGLARVKEPIAFGQNVQSINLPKPGTEVTGVVTAMGWGYIDYGTGKKAKALQVVDLPVQPQKDCEEEWRSNKYDPSSVFCAGGNPKHATCHGDSGGPLIQHQNKVPVLVGIVYGGYKCGSTGVPGFYTKVSAAVEWINKHRQNTLKETCITR